MCHPEPTYGFSTGLRSIASPKACSTSAVVPFAVSCTETTTPATLERGGEVAVPRDVLQRAVGVAELHVVDREPHRVELFEHTGEIRRNAGLTTSSPVRATVEAHVANLSRRSCESATGHPVVCVRLANGYTVRVRQRPDGARRSCESRSDQDERRNKDGGNTHIPPLPRGLSSSARDRGVPRTQRRMVSRFIHSSMMRWLTNRSLRGLDCRRPRAGETGWFEALAPRKLIFGLAA